MRLPKFEIARVEKRGELMYLVNVPAAFSATKKRARMYFRTRADAQTFRSSLLEQARGGGAPPLSEAQEADARAAFAVLAEAKCALSLAEVARRAVRSLSLPASGMLLADLLAEFEGLRAEGWRPLTRRNFRAYSRLMLAAFPDATVAEVTDRALEGWLARFAGKDGKAGYAQNVARTLRPAFTYALRRHYVAENPFSTVELGGQARRAAVATAGIDVLSPADAARVMAEAQRVEGCRAPFALLLFAGVRPVELERLRWGHVRDGFIHLTAEVAKTRQARNVEICETLAAWLALEGEHNPAERVVPPCWRRRSSQVRKAAGVDGRPDVARHSFASYWLALWPDVDRLKANMGHARNSEQLFIHYRAAATAADARAFWAVLP